MKNLSNTLICLSIILTSCATSMAPSEFNISLPKLTQSRFLNQAELEEKIKNNTCKYLVKGRKYSAPVGLTVKNDLKYGAQGIDEWVKLDGGNSYVIRNYEWVTIGDSGGTQLRIEFDTIKCE